MGKGPPVLRLHGIADGNPDKDPVVLGRDDYRKRLYVEGAYTNFLRAVLGSYTILYLGVSFTDAYLNELRSEALAFVNANSGGNKNPLAYAVLENRSPEMQAFYEQHEGIQVLPFDVDFAKKPVDFQGFDDWLESIKKRTAPEERLRALLASEGQAREIVWLDPAGDARNEPGISLLGRVGAKVTIIKEPDDLNQEKHSSAALLITHFGYRDHERPVVEDVMRHLRTWDDRPPVVVFASPEHAKKNRARVLRLGAWEYASRWGELFRLIEGLFGRADVSL